MLVSSNSYHISTPCFCSGLLSRFIRTVNGESTFEIEEQSTSKMKTVTVTRNVYTLSYEANAEFKTIHDEWELDVRERNPYDALIGGSFSLYESFQDNNYCLTISENNFPLKCLLRACPCILNQECRKMKMVLMV